ncbi:sugar transferase [Priestia aryabhattai]|uniref:sugar transferase n=1 Tax=Priestia aryabhattai TaxID=412384 RepID=UPI003D26F1A8
MEKRESRKDTEQQSSLYLNEVVQKKYYDAIKRYIDILGSLIGIIVLAPIFLIVIILIKIENMNSSVFFKQIRIGEKGQPFVMYKFRSMVANAEDLLEGLRDQNETTGAMFKIRNDPRITRVGKFIRKTSIDELPQLINVLRGNMSLVGPRPPLVEEVKQYSPYHKQRLLVKPGCTGLWQVSGRSNIGFEEMVDLDLKYIKNRNILYDLSIILKTFRVVFGSKDAF